VTNLSAGTFVFQIFLKDGGQRPVINLKGLNQFVGRTFQDGGPSYPFKAFASRGLDGKNGSDGYIPSDTCSSNTPASTKSIYQGPEASGGLLKASGLSIDYLPGQSTDITSGWGSTPPISKINLPTLQESGPNSKPQEISLDTNKERGVPRVQHQFSINGVISSSRETEENPTGCQTTVDSVNSIDL